MFTKLRSFPCSLYRCCLRPVWRFVRLASSSPTVEPSASTASRFSVYGRSGVGIRMVGMMQGALDECGPVVVKKPDRHQTCRRAGGAFARPAVARDGNDDVRKRRPGMIEIVLRRPRRMIGMRMIEAEQFGMRTGGAALGQPIV